MMLYHRMKIWIIPGLNFTRVSCRLVKDALINSVLPRRVRMTCHDPAGKPDWTAKATAGDRQGSGMIIGTVNRQSGMTLSKPERFRVDVLLERRHVSV